MKRIDPKWIAGLLAFLALSVPSQTAHAQAVPGRMVQYWNSAEQIVFRDGGAYFADGNRVGIVYARAYLRDGRPQLEKTTWRYIDRTSDWSNYDEAYAWARKTNSIALFRLNPTITSRHPSAAPDALPMIGRGMLDLSKPAARQALERFWAEAARRYPQAFFDVAFAGFSGEPTGGFEWWTVYDKATWREVMRWCQDAHVRIFGADRLVTNAGVYEELLERAWSQGIRAIRDDGYGGDERQVHLRRLKASGAGKFLSDPNAFAIWETWYDIGRWDDLPTVTASADRLMRESIALNGLFLGNMGSSVPASKQDVVRRHFVEPAERRSLPGRWANPWGSTASPQGPPPKQPRGAARANSAASSARPTAKEAIGNEVSVRVQGPQARIERVVTVPWEQEQWTGAVGNSSYTFKSQHAARIYLRAAGQGCWAIRSGGTWRSDDGPQCEAVSSIRTEGRPNLLVEFVLGRAD
ncbi:MAG: hypothetical protein AAGI08_05025 [Bacteroidota bacterium]